MNVAMYLRKSRSDPDDESIDETLARHKKTLLNFAKNNKLTITDIYEEVVSGDGLFVRPEMIRLLSDIEKNIYDGVLCVDIDRLGRVDTKDRGIILDTFKSHNTKIITPRKIYDLNNDIDEFSTEIEMLLARQELKKITQRMQAGIRRTLEDGYHVGEPPYGYKRTYINKRPTLAINEEEAAVVRKIFDMYVNDGVGSEIIADTINSMGYKTRKNTAFSRSTIRFILQNETYIGKIIWNKRKHIKKKRPVDKHHSILNPEEEWIVAQGVHEAIIDDETFSKAQEIKKTRSHPPSNTGVVKNPFAGLLRCKNCGQLMSRQTYSRTEPRLLCTNNACNKSTTVSKVEDAVLNSLKNYLAEFKLKLKNENNSEQENKKKELDTKILEIKKQLSVYAKQKESLHDLLEQGIYDIATFQHRGKILEENTAQLNDMLLSAQKELNALSHMPTIGSFIPTMEFLINNYDTLDAAEKNRLFKKILKGITYYRPHKNGASFDVELEFKDYI